MLDPIALLKEYVSHASVSADSAYREQVQSARHFISKLLEQVGFQIKTIPTPLYDIVLAKRHINPDWPTLLIYGHYDVQPADPIDLWTSPPFTGTVRGDRLYGRGASDNKGTQIVHICALEKALQAQPDLPLNITFLIEGEEEIGSPSFPQFLRQHKAELAGEFILVSDSSIPSPDQVTITSGLRGLCALEVEVTGPQIDLHSGVHGGAVMNPILALSRILSGLHDETGRVTVPGFYDHVVEPHHWEKEQLAQLTSEQADYFENYQKFLGAQAFYSEAGYNPAEAIRFRPTLEFNGIGGGYQGEGSKTVIPSTAFTKISCRLVPGQTPEEIYPKVEQAITALCPKEVQLTITPGHGGQPYGISPATKPGADPEQNPLLQRAFPVAEKAFAQHFPQPTLYLKEGGSIPIIADLKTIAGLDSLMIGLTTPQDTIHSPDESFHLGVMQRGIDAFSQFFTELAQAKVEG